MFSDMYLPESDFKGLKTFQKQIFPGEILAIVAMDSYGIHPIVCQSSIFDHGAHCLGHLCGRKC